MVAVKTHQAQAFLAAVERLPPAVLLYGTDAGLVAERASQLAKRLAERETPPGEVLRIDDDSLEADPDRIHVELRTPPMFGGRKIVRAPAGRRVTAALIEGLVKEGGLEGYLIVEAGSLRPDDAMRALFERSPAAAAVACFPDEARDLDAIIRETLAAGGTEITTDARRLLIARLGADRGLSRAEIDKLALYAHGKAAIDEADVEAAVGDAAEQALDRVVMAVASGRGAAALVECDRSVAAGEDPQAVIAAVQRHFLRLHRLRTALDAGRSMDDAIRGLRPQPHFKQRDALEAQARAWSAAGLAAALARIAAAAKAARLGADLGGLLAERLLIDLAEMAGGGVAPARRR